MTAARCFVSAEKLHLEADLKTAEILAGKAAGGFADVFREEVYRTGVVLEDKKIEAALLGRDSGVALRIELPGISRFSHSPEPHPDELPRMAEDLAGENFPTGLVFKPPETPQSAMAPDPSGGRSLAELVNLLEMLDRIARAEDPRVVQVRISYGDYARFKRITDSSGRVSACVSEGVRLWALVTANDGRTTQTGYESIAAATGWEIFGKEPAEAMVLGAARRAVAMLGARKAPGGPMPVVLAAEAGGTMIHEAVGHGLEADLVLEGHSVYAGMLGKKVASPLVTVIDDPSIPGRNGSYAIDDEGTVAARTILIEDGVLKGYLSCRRTARELSAAPSGNGRRESCAHPPIPRMSNTFIARGETHPSTIISATDRGLYVTRMGGGQVDTVSGDFVFEVAEGFLIEKGLITDPVRQATITGNGPEVLLSIDMVGSDLGFGNGTCGKDGQGVPVADAQPTLRIPELNVGSCT